MIREYVQILFFLDDHEASKNNRVRIYNNIFSDSNLVFYHPRAVLLFLIETEMPMRIARRRDIE
jgi:hypothetical protein